MRALQDAQEEALLRVARSGVFTTFGDEVPALEDALSRRIGVPAVAVNSGTSALALGLSALDLDPGLVIVPAICCAAVPQAVIRAGHRPLLVDVGADGLLSPESVALTLRSRNVTAVIGVDLDGRLADWDGIRKAVDGRVPVIHDACPSFGAVYEGTPVGRLDGIAFTAVSFNGQKLVPAGEGGAVISRDPELCRRVREARAFGESATRLTVRRGDNARMTEMSAALARAGLDHLDALIDRARIAAIAMDRVLGAWSWMGRPGSVPVRGRFYHNGDRDQVVRALLSERVPIALEPPPLYRHPYSRLATSGRFPGAELFYERTLILGERTYPFCRWSGREVSRAAYRIVGVLEGAAV